MPRSTSLSSRDILCIQTAYLNGVPQSEIAARFAISQGYVSKILSKRVIRNPYKKPPFNYSKRLPILGLNVPHSTQPNRGLIMLFQSKVQVLSVSRYNFKDPSDNRIVSGAKVTYKGETETDERFRGVRILTVAAPESIFSQLPPKLPAEVSLNFVQKMKGKNPILEIASLASNAA